MGMHKSMLGKIGPGSADVTLGDYIARKQQAAAFDDVAKENKLTFHEWYLLNEKQTYDKNEYECMEMAWQAAQENK